MISKDLSLEELIKEINSKPNKDISIKRFLDLFFQISANYMDYYESDLGGFLSKNSFSKYYLYSLLRIIFFLSFITNISLFVFSEASWLSATFGIIAFVILFVIIFVDNNISTKFWFTKSFFHSKGKKLVFLKDC